MTADPNVAHRALYTATPTPTLIEVPPRPHLMIDGRGDPNTGAEYATALAALYPLAYAVRAAVKDRCGAAYKVMPLEGLWWVPDGERFTMDDKTNWQWTSMISLPDDVDDEFAAHLSTEVLPAVTRAKRLLAGHLARIERFGDGLAAQVLHRGPYADEPETIANLHQWIDRSGQRLTGRHHEIYLSDPRKGDPAKHRTIIRQPVT